ncbi:MAG: Na/Pi cotransporter family protein [Oscillospiraceae bacterium]|jgi:phosphate:Na+ symporter|nr:Na/Pi cotransporter family protein [Oscillospiraceae bacterium]
MDYIGIALKFLGSFGLFIFGISLLSSALQKTAGGRMKQILGSVSKYRFNGVLFGAGVTATIQSSTATTVMAVGFVNAGIIALPQIVGIIMGANVGSTFTSWLVSSVEWSSLLKPDALGAVCAASGALILLFSKDKGTKNIGEIVVGFGVLFLGLSQMPEAVRPLAELDAAQQLFISMGSNPILGILAGILVTAVIQSSAASIGILQSMAFTGMVPWNAAVYIVLGQNIGTCLTAVLSGIGASKNAQAAAYIHLVYNVVGAVIFCVGGVVFFTFIDPTLGASAITATNISMVHTGYNIAALFLLFPFGKFILNISKKMAGIGKSGTLGDAADLPELDMNILETPSYALENSSKAILKLMSLMRKNLVLGVDIFINKEYKKITGFWSKAKEIDRVNDKINEFLTMLFGEKLSEDENTRVTSLIHATISLKRISNRTKGFAKLAEDMRNNGTSHVNNNDVKMRQIYDKTMLCYNDMITAFKTQDNEVINQIMQNADDIAILRDEYKSGYLTQASSAGYSVETGIAFSEATRHLARIASNIKSVAEAVSPADTMADFLDEAYKRR